MVALALEWRGVGQRAADQQLYAPSPVRRQGDFRVLSPRSIYTVRYENCGDHRVVRRSS